MTADNLSRHATQAIRTFPLEHPNVHLHFHAEFSWWRNQVELWSAKIERNLRARHLHSSR